MNNEILFKVKCTNIEISYLTVGKEYDVVEVDEGFYKVKNDRGKKRWYCNNRFEIVETPPKDKQEFSVGDKVVVNKISGDYVPLKDKNVKVGDKVYKFGDVDVKTILEVFNDGYMQLTNLLTSGLTSNLK